MSSEPSLVPSVRGLGPSATLAINERCEALRRQGRTVFKLGLGQSPFPVPEPVVEELRRHAHEKAYLPVQGLAELRQAVAEYHWQKDRIEVRADQVLIGPGSKELLFLLQLVFAGELLVPTPSWVSYIPQARILGRRPRTIPISFEEGWRITPRHLDQLCASEDCPSERLLVLNYPNNPAGMTYSVRELEALAEVCRRHRIVVLSDEIYGELHFEGAHVSIRRFYPEGTIVSSGLSKWCGAGGWRLGTFAFPRQLTWLMEAMAAVASETYTSVSAPIQHAAVRAFQGGIRIETYLSDARRILSTLGHRCHRMLGAAGVRLHPPEGAFYLFLDFSSLEGIRGRGAAGSGAGLCERLLEETGVAILPGVAFGRPEDELTARLSFVDFDGAQALDEAAEIPLGEELPEGFLTRRCGDTLQAVERITDWVKR